jgi:hypothetical protein
MKLTIIKDDNAVYLDGKSFSNLNLTVPTNIHALQWNNDFGHIEYVNSEKPNETINELPEWTSNCLNAWQNAFDAEQEAIILKQKQPETKGMTEL